MNTSARFFLTLSVMGILVFPRLTFAHVSVKPNQVGVGSFQTFSVGVPVEKDVATTQVRVVIPEGLEHVTPNVKPGWTIETVKQTTAMGNRGMGMGMHADDTVTEIIWRGGRIPAGQRDDFFFSAKVPATPTSLAWKAYQTYTDGTVVAWELGSNEPQPTGPDGAPDFSTVGPASMTKVIDDLTADTNTKPAMMGYGSNMMMGSMQWLPWAVVLSLVLSGVSLAMQLGRKPTSSRKR